MGKTHITISIDDSIFTEFQSIIGRGNVSGKVEEYMGNLVNLTKEDSSAINVRLVKNKLINLEDEHSKRSIEITALRQQLQMYEKVQIETENQKLQQEKERIENQNKCANCGNILGEKVRSHKFSIGLICNPCFMTSNKESIKKWTNE